MNDGQPKGNDVEGQEAEDPRYYGAKQSLAGMSTGPVNRITTRQRLLAAKAEMERRTADIDQAIALLDKNPDTEELLNLLGRVGY